MKILVTGMLVMIPCSYLADKYGRRVVFLLAELGLSMAMGWMLLICTLFERIVSMPYIADRYRLLLENNTHSTRMGLCRLPSRWRRS